MHLTAAYIGIAVGFIVLAALFASIEFLFNLPGLMLGEIASFS
jgi:hypothetical protein